MKEKKLNGQKGGIKVITLVIIALVVIIAVLVGVIVLGDRDNSVETPTNTQNDVNRVESNTNERDEDVRNNVVVNNDEEEDEEEQRPTSEATTGNQNVNHPILGTWGWNANGRFTQQYIFNSDGTGTRGLTIPIRWDIPEPGHLMIGSGGGTSLTESWSYTIINGELTITSRQVDNMSFTYGREQ